MKAGTTTMPLRADQTHTVPTDRVQAGVAEATQDEGGLTDQTLLRICRVREVDPQVTTEWLGRLRLVTALMRGPHLNHGAPLDAALTVLASALGQLAHYQPTHLPFGYEGPRLVSRDWIERGALERVGKQIVGLMWPNASAEDVAAIVHQAVAHCAELGFLEQREYDAWRPGMPSGSGWRTAVTATPYGIARARALAGRAPNRSAVGNKGPSAATEASEGDQTRVNDGGTTADTSPRTRRRAKRRPRRGRRTANIEMLEKELENHLLAARDHAHALCDRGTEPALLPRPSQKELAQRTGLSRSDVSRCLHDRRARVLTILWETAGSLDAVMRFKRRR